MRSIIVDFKVFHGTTSGEAIYNDQAEVLAGYTTKCNLVIGITDTTGSMGVLGKHLRDNGMEHAYCTWAWDRLYYRRFALIIWDGA